MNSSMKVEITLYDQLTIYSDTGDITYQGKPDGYPVGKACSANGLILILLKYWEKKYGAFNNLLLLEPNGEVLWRAELPTPSSTDAYVDFEFKGDKLFANSWTCYRVEVDMKTGKIVYREFTK